MALWWPAKVGMEFVAARADTGSTSLGHPFDTFRISSDVVWNPLRMICVTCEGRPLGTGGSRLEAVWNPCGSRVWN